MMLLKQTASGGWLASVEPNANRKVSLANDVIRGLIISMFICGATSPSRLGSTNQAHGASLLV